MKKGRCEETMSQIKTVDTEIKSEDTGKVRIKMIPTEIYSRVVGYYRPIQNWNKGKVEEFGERKLIDPESPFKNA